MLLALHCNFLRWSFFRGIKITSENVVSKRSPDTLLVEFKLSPKQPFNGKVGNRKLPRYLLWVYKLNVLSVNPLFSCGIVQNEFLIKLLKPLKSNWGWLWLSIVFELFTFGPWKSFKEPRKCLKTKFDKFTSRCVWARHSTFKILYFVKNKWPNWPQVVSL